MAATRSVAEVLCEATPLDYSLEESHLQTTVANPTPFPYDFVREALRRAGATTADSPASFHRKLRSECERLLSGAFAGWSAARSKSASPWRW